jgi:hypothetical protein
MSTERIELPRALIRDWRTDAQLAPQGGERHVAASRRKDTVLGGK